MNHRNVVYLLPWPGLAEPSFAAILTQLLVRGYVRSPLDLIGLSTQIPLLHLLYQLLVPFVYFVGSNFALGGHLHVRNFFGALPVLLVNGHGWRLNLRHDRRLDYLLDHFRLLIESVIQSLNLFFVGLLFLSLLIQPPLILPDLLSVSVLGVVGSWLDRRNDILRLSMLSNIDVLHVSIDIVGLEKRLIDSIQKPSLIDLF